MNQKNIKPPLGQHFLENKAAIKKIITSLNLVKGDTVIEIGPGKGALTVPLVTACKKIGCTVVAVEKDRALTEELEQKLEIGNEKVEMVLGDVLKVLPKLVGELSARGGSSFGGEIGNWKLVGNIPYYITGKLLRVLSELPQKPLRTILTIQREVAERIVAEPPRMNLLAAAVQIWATPKILMRLHPNDFSPPPQVDSAILLLETKPYTSYPSSAQTLAGKKLLITNHYSFIRHLFKQPRKTAVNNLRAGYPKKTFESIKKELEHQKIAENARPQDISMQVLIKLASYFEV